MNTQELRGALAALVEANAVVEERIASVLELARGVDAGDRECGRVVLAAAGVEVVADFLLGVAWPLSVRTARTWRSFAISSSMAFNIWSFKDVPFVL